MKPKFKLRIHLTNIFGAGAVQLIQSLLPDIEKTPGFSVEKIYLPDRGVLKCYKPENSDTLAVRYVRFLPNILSRLFEVTLLARRFEDASPLLVFGDIPLSCKAPQTVFVQTSHLTKPATIELNLGYFKYFILRTIFQLNMHHVRSFIVQTKVMRMALEASYPSIAGRVHVLPQPVPSWLLHSGVKRLTTINDSSQGLRLIYPSTFYKHKNHTLLSLLSSKERLPVKELILTLDQSHNPAPTIPWISCTGFLSPQAMIESYLHVDALLFLSKTESYGFPLIEAMYVGIPIICPALPYAESLCGDQAIYFDPECPQSLSQAFLELHKRLESGWWPDWSQQLQDIPTSWGEVARRILEIVKR